MEKASRMKVISHQWVTQSEDVERKEDVGGWATAGDFWKSAD